MWLTPGLLALATLGAEGPAGPARSITPVQYQVRVLEMKGIDWRGKWHDRMEPLARQGTATIWTAGRDLVPALVKSAERVVGDPKVAAAPSASATVRHEVGRHIVADLKRVADGPFGRAGAVAFQPQIDRITESFQATVSCRRIAQGVLAKVAIEDTHLAAIHTTSLHEDLRPDPSKKGGEPTGVTAQFQVPEVVSSQVQGEWLIPNDGVLVVSLGIHTTTDPRGKAYPEERLAIIETRDEPNDEPATPGADADARRVSNEVAFPTPMPPDAPPGAGRPTPLRMSVTIGAPFVFPYPMPVPPTPGVHVIAGDREVAHPVPPAQPAKLPTPPPPTRHLPTPIGPDGKVAELPPLPDDEVAPASDESGTSAEPRPSPQTKPLPAAPGTGESKDGETTPKAKPADPAVVNEVVKTFLLLAKKPMSPAIKFGPGEAKNPEHFETRFAATQAPPDSCCKGHPGPCASASEENSSRSGRIGAQFDPDDAAKLVKPYTDEVAQVVAVAGCREVATPATTSDATKAEVWALTLRDAIRIGLENSECVRVVRLGVQGVGGASAEIPLALKDISALACEVEGRRTANHPEGCCEGPSRVPTAIVAKMSDGVSTERFKAEVAAMVRSIEQQYWALAAQQERLRASEAAVDLGRRILERERAKFKVGSGSVPNVAEAEENYERFQLQFVSDTADVITTERQLRNILGLPPADGRRIVPVTPPVEAEVAYVWETCLRDMVACQPDVVVSREALRVATARLLATCAPLGPCAMLPDLATGVAPCEVPGESRKASQEFLRSRAFLQQVVHQTTHSLSRMFLEVDVNNRQRQNARRLKAAALQRLNAQKASYEAGQITIDRYLDAVNRWANAVSQEAEFQGRYCTSIAALEEAKGTLLECDGIHVIDHRRVPARVATSEKTADVAVGRSSFNPPAEDSGPPRLRLEAGVAGASGGDGPGIVNARIMLDPEKASKEPVTVRIALPGGDVMEIRASVTKAPVSPPKCCTGSCESGPVATDREGSR